MVIRTLKYAVVLGATVICLVPAFWVIAYFYEIHAAKGPVENTADAIVVFSGDWGRISAGADLLKKGFAPRLLIVGQDNDAEVVAVSKAQPLLSTCCITVKPRSKTTLEDAISTSGWVQETGVKSLILVTSDYHIPRAVLELRRALPTTRIRPVSVATGPLDVPMVWQNSNRARLIRSQLMKFAAASIPGMRDNLDTPVARRVLLCLSEDLSLPLRGMPCEADDVTDRHDPAKKPPVPSKLNVGNGSTAEKRK